MGWTLGLDDAEIKLPDAKDAEVAQKTQKTQKLKGSKTKYLERKRIDVVAKSSDVFQLISLVFFASFAQLLRLLRPAIENAF